MSNYYISIQKGLKIRKNQNVRRKSEKGSKIRKFPDFSEDLATLVLMSFDHDNSRNSIAVVCVKKKR
jgi:hypothetical protein